MHVPAATNVIVAPLTPPDMHTDGVADENDTANPDDADAFTVTGESANDLSDNAPNEIV